MFCTRFTTNAHIIKSKNQYRHIIRKVGSRFACHISNQIFFPLVVGVLFHLSSRVFPSNIYAVMRTIPYCLSTFYLEYLLSFSFDSFPVQTNSNTLVQTTSSTIYISFSSFFTFQQCYDILFEWKGQRFQLSAIFS